MQEFFDYTEQEMRRLERAISPERLKAYLVLARGDLWVALHLYARNTQLSEALYGVLQGLEVLLRNATHETLAKAFQSQDWFQMAPLRDSERNDVQDAKEKIQARIVPVTPGRIVAEMTLGFWVNLYASSYEKELWVKYLNPLFPARLARRQLHDRLSLLRTLRNRIAHHESLLKRDVHQDYKDLVETIHWLSPTFARWIRVTNCFEERFAVKVA